MVVIPCVRGIGSSRIGMPGGVLMNRIRDEWGTPQWLFDKLNEIFKFTLDAAASCENAKCTEYFDKDSDGLFHVWGKNHVWCNPPYSGKNLSLWAAKMYEEAQRGCVIVALILVGPDTSWWHDYIFKANALLFPRGRIGFVAPPGIKASSPPRATCLVFFNPPVGTLDQLSFLGKIVRLF